MDVPHFGTAQLVTNVVHLSETPGAGFRRPPPVLGEHTAEVMTEPGFSKSDIDDALGLVEGAEQALIDAVYGD